MLKFFANHEIKIFYLNWINLLGFFFINYFTFTLVFYAEPIIFISIKKIYSDYFLFYYLKREI